MKTWGILYPNISSGRSREWKGKDKTRRSSGTSRTGDTLENTDEIKIQEATRALATYLISYSALAVRMMSPSSFTVSLSRGIVWPFAWSNR